MCTHLAIYQTKWVKTKIAFHIPPELLLRRAARYHYAKVHICIRKVRVYFTHHDAPFITPSSQMSRTTEHFFLLYPLNDLQTSDSSSESVVMAPKCHALISVSSRDTGKVKDGISAQRLQG